MNSEQIKTHLDSVNQEIANFLAFKGEYYIAGGCIASLVLDEEVKDYDCWFDSPEHFDAIEVCINNFNLPVTKKTKYATTITLPSGKIVQFVKNRMGVPEVLVPQFDFKHAQSYYKQDGTLVYDENFIQSRTLVFKGKFDHPINTMERVLKFSKRGYFVPPETLQDIMLEITKLDPQTIKTATKHKESM